MPTGKHLVRALRLLGIPPRTAGLLARHVVANCDDIISADSLALFLIDPITEAPQGPRRREAEGIRLDIVREWGREAEELLDVIGGMKQVDVEGQQFLPMFETWLEHRTACPEPPPFDPDSSATSSGTAPDA